MRQPPTSDDFISPVHDTGVVARLGVWLGAAFLICFLTGLVSHLHQHPVAWLPLSPTPSWRYRCTQGLQVATGVACPALGAARTVFVILPGRLRKQLRVIALAAASLALIGIPLPMNR